MFNRTLLITRRTVARVALTIAIGKAARTTSAFAVGPQRAPVPLVRSAHEVALAPAAARRRDSDRRFVRRRRAPATALRRTAELHTDTNWS